MIFSVFLSNDKMYHDLGIIKMQECFLCSLRKEQADWAHPSKPYKKALMHFSCGGHYGRHCLWNR